MRCYKQWSSLVIFGLGFRCWQSLALKRELQGWSLLVMSTFFILVVHEIYEQCQFYLI